MSETEIQRLKRELSNEQRTRQRLGERIKALENENRELRTEAAGRRLVQNYIPAIYAQTFYVVHAAAIEGVRRSDDLGGVITGTAPQSRPPAHNAPAYNIIHREKGWLSKTLSLRAGQMLNQARHAHEAYSEGAEEGKSYQGEDAA